MSKQLKYFLFGDKKLNDFTSDTFQILFKILIKSQFELGKILLSKM